MKNILQDFNEKVITYKYKYYRIWNNEYKYQLLTGIF